MSDNEKRTALEKWCERHFHAAFEKWLREQRIVFVTTRMDRASTIAVGDPDYWILSPTRAALAVELKTEKGKLSKAQVKRHAELKEAGFTVHILRNIGAAIELVKAWGEASPEPQLLGKRAGLFIADIGKGRGDWVCDYTGMPLRRATISDVCSLPRI